MSRRLLASVLFGAALVLVAQAQPPDSPQPAGKAADKNEKKAVDPLDALIGTALANDADVRVAQAKLHLADAELAKARQAVTQKIVTLQASIDDQKRVVASAQDFFKIAQAKYGSGTIPFAEFVPIRDRLDAAKAQLARLETEMKLLTGGSFRIGAENWKDADGSGVRWRLLDQSKELALITEALLSKEKPRPTGPIPDRIRAALDQSVKLGAEGGKVTIQEALDVFKKAGLPSRMDGVNLNPIISQGEELSIGAWLQLFADRDRDACFVVREYGLLVTLKHLAPPDALTVSEFWKKPPAPKAQEQTPGPKKADRP
jgi:hypothetical protein